MTKTRLGIRIALHSMVEARSLEKVFTAHRRPLNEARILTSYVVRHLFQAYGDNPHCQGGLLLTRLPSYGAEVGGVYTKVSRKDFGVLIKVYFFKRQTC